MVGTRRVNCSALPRLVLEAQAEMVSRDEFSTSHSCPAESKVPESQL